MKLRQLVNKGDFVKVCKDGKVLYVGYTNFIKDDMLNNDVLTSFGRCDMYKRIYIL